MADPALAGIDFRAQPDGASARPRVESDLEEGEDPERESRREERGGDEVFNQLVSLPPNHISTVIPRSRPHKFFA
jgi:hypothetical protein